MAGERLDAMKALSESGIPSWAFVGPVIPGVLTEDNIGKLVNEIKAAGASRILIDLLRLKPGLSEAMEAPLKQLSEITGCACELKPSGSHSYDLIKEKTVRLCAELHLPCEPGL
jgi:DNA repair photolyase